MNTAGRRDVLRLADIDSVVVDNPTDLEPVSGIEPLTCRLQGGRSAI